MAASLAAAALGDIADVTSAGVDASGQRASEKTITLMRCRHGIDLSAHRSVDVENLSLNDFDYIIAMKADYAARIVTRFGILSAKVIQWDVDDPMIENTDAAYERCLAQIEKLLEPLLKQIRNQTGTFS